MIQEKKLKEYFGYFCHQMRMKLYEKEKESFTGWNDKNNIDMLKQKLYEHVGKLIFDNDHRQDVDIANLSMFIGCIIKRKQDKKIDKCLKLLEK